MSISIGVLGLDGTRSNTILLPTIFRSPYRPDVIHKVYINSLSHRFQRQGRYPAAGEIVSAESRNTGLGMARIARARGEGFPRAGQAAGVAGVRHGRLSHPPESWKNIYKKVNKKEKGLALRSAIAATARKDLIVKRGHKIGNISEFPILVSEELESLAKTKDLKTTLINLGLKEDMDRAAISRKGRSGTARRRGRKGHVAHSALIVTSSGDAKVRHLSGSLPGVQVKALNQLNVLDLAPGSRQVRLTIFSTSAIEELRERYSGQDTVNQKNE